MNQSINQSINRREVKMEEKEKMDKVVKRMIMKQLTGLGYMPREDEHGTISFCYRMKTFYIVVEDKTEPLVSVVYPCFVKVEKADLKAHMVVCNKLNRESKSIKVYMDSEFQQVSACIEFIHTGTRSLRQNITHAMEYLEPVRVAYKMILSDL